MDEARESCLIIFYRNPAHGKVKTRLAQSVGPEKALLVYKKLVEHTRAIADGLKQKKIVYYSESVEQRDIWTPSVYTKASQGGSDLGERMESAFRDAFRAGHPRVCIIGTDCYELTTKIIEDAFSALDHSDVVVGPAVDGGYYLLGMKALHGPLFKSKSWGTEHVFRETAADIEAMGLSCHALPLLRDVDRVEDLPAGW